MRSKRSITVLFPEESETVQTWSLDNLSILIGNFYTKVWFSETRSEIALSESRKPLSFDGLLFSI